MQDSNALSIKREYTGEIEQDGTVVLRVVLRVVLSCSINDDRRQLAKAIQDRIEHVIQELESTSARAIVGGERESN